MNDSGMEADGSDEALKPMNTEVIRLLLENQPAFLNFLRKRLPSREISEDLLQQGFLKAVKHEESLAVKESAVSWFYRILLNMTTDFYRSRASEERKNDSFHAEAAALDQNRVPALDEDLRKEICACMNGLLPVLNPGYSDLIRRIDLEGQEPAKVAEETGITYNNLMVRLHRARQALRIGLERVCGTCTKHGCLDCTCGSATGP